MLKHEICCRCLRGDTNFIVIIKKRKLSLTPPFAVDTCTQEPSDSLIHLLVTGFGNLINKLCNEVFIATLGGIFEDSVGFRQK
eukprot:9446132-Karenia_brevis.AAC.1